jgi:iron complex transport system permease protein
VAIAGLTALLAMAFVTSLVAGSTWIPFARVLAILTGDAAGSADATVLWAIRLPRSLTAMLAGASLGVAGLQMQTLFRNPLADPFALGVSAGASLGVALVVLGGGLGAATVFGGAGLAGDVAITVAAIAGAATVLSLVLAVSARVESPATVLIVGLMAGYAVSAFVIVLVGASEPDRLQQWTAWGFGSFSGVTWSRLRLFGPLTLGGIGLAAATTKQLNALLLGERYAQSMGMAVRQVRLTTVFGASVLGAVVTAFCGPISFLGIAVPHLCRGLLGTTDHRPLVPAAALLGGSVALAAQLVSFVPGPAGVLPLNAVTSLVGAPIVIAVLMRARRGELAG